MATEQRLIDVSKVINAMQKCLDDNRGKKYSVAYMMFESIITALKNAPTVDAVEVVRCKDCKHCDTFYPRKEIGKEPTQVWYCDRYRCHREPDDFCSYGERRADHG